VEVQAGRAAMVGACSRFLREEGEPLRAEAAVVEKGQRAALAREGAGWASGVAGEVLVVSVGGERGHHCRLEVGGALPSREAWVAAFSCLPVYLQPLVLP